MILNFILAFAIPMFNSINVPVCDMREKPQIDSEIVSQAYFSEAVSPLETQDDWVKIETAVDHYQGWIKRSALCPKPHQNSEVIATVHRNAAHLYHVQDTVYGPVMTIPFESKLAVLETKLDPANRWIKVGLPDGREAFIQSGDVSLNPRIISRNELPEFSMRFLGIPYTWGGRSSFGYDCSGFVQMLYRQMNVFLPRDARDQVQWKGFQEVAFDNLTPGDLIFWGPAEDRIRHVGLYIGDNEFIHATVKENAPYIHVSKLVDPEWNGSSTLTYRTARTLR